MNFDDKAGVKSFDDLQKIIEQVNNDSGFALHSWKKNSVECDNVYTLTAYCTGFPGVLVTAHSLIYEGNAMSQLIYSITLATEQRY